MRYRQQIPVEICGFHVTIFFQFHLLLIFQLSKIVMTKDLSTPQQVYFFVFFSELKLFTFVENYKTKTKFR